MAINLTTNNNPIRTQIDNLSPDKQRAVLQKLIDWKRLTAAKRKNETFDLQPVPRDRDFPLSYEQAYLWNQHRLSGNRAELVMDLPPLQLKDVNVAAMEESLTRLVERHESLRTTFHTAHAPQVEGTLIQRVHPAQSYQLEVVEYSRLRVLGVNKIIAEQMQTMAMEPFDLEAGPLWRCKLLTRGRDSLLLFTFCALIFDGGSINIFFDELMALYEATVQEAHEQQRPASLPHLEIHYADYADWQHRYMKRPEQQAHLRWWQEQLDGYQELRLGNRGSGLVEQTYECLLYEQVIHGDLLGKLAAYAKERDVTLYMVMLTAFKMMLAEFSDQEEIVVGTPLSDRYVPQTQPIIGHFVNYLALRTHLPLERDLGNVLQAVAQTAVRAFEHQTTPHGLLVETLNISSGNGPSPFRVIFNYRNVENPDFIDEQLQNGVEGRSHQDDFQVKELARRFTRDEDLLLRLEDAGEHKVATWFVRRDILDPTTVNQMIQRFQTILQEIEGADPRKNHEK